LGEKKKLKDLIFATSLRNAAVFLWEGLKLPLETGVLTTRKRWPGTFLEGFPGGQLKTGKDVKVGAVGSVQSMICCSEMKGSTEEGGL